MVRLGIILLALSTAKAAVAELPRALVIGVPDSAAPMAFADSYNVAQALRAAGLPEVTLVRDRSLTEIRRTWDAVDPDLLYVTGPFPRALSGRLRGEDRPDILLLDDCSSPIEVSGNGVATASDAALCDNGGISALISRATAAQVARDFNGVLRTAWSAAPPERFEIDSAQQAAARQPIAVVSASVAAVTPVSPVAPISAVATSASSAITGTAPEGVTDDASVAIFLSGPSSQQVAQPTREGYPEPSIILGVIAPTPASFPTAADDDAGQAAQADLLGGAEISYQNLEARRALKESDPQLFETLVAGGAFDPPDVELATALQTELARMGCYRSGIDGIWGGGSRGSVQRYWDQIPNADGDVEPTIELFRQIMRKDDVTCPAPAVAAPRRSTPTATRTTTTRRATTTRSAPQRTQTRTAPAAPRTQQRTLRGSGSLIGTFR